jgi:putative transposase
VIDLYSRKVVGWSVGSRMEAQLVCDALTMAVWQRLPKAESIVHSVQGFNMLAINIVNYSSYMALLAT